jgi:carbon monoxide dehydrogenase subunit G
MPRLVPLCLLAIFACACGAAGNGSTLPAKSTSDAAVLDEAASTLKANPSDAAVPLENVERALLVSGQVITKPVQFERGSSKYVGGLASGLVPAAPERVLQAIQEPDALLAMLPRTKRVTLVDASTSSRRLELLQGNSFVDATYTVKLVPSDKPGELTFQMDRSRHHDIDDVYGYFKVERFDDKRSLVTVAAAVDVGSDLTNLLFGKRVQEVILSTPYAMRDYFARIDSGSGRTGPVAQN